MTCWVTMTHYTLQLQITVNKLSRAVRSHVTTIKEHTTRKSTLEVSDFYCEQNRTAEMIRFARQQLNFTTTTTTALGTIISSTMPTSETVTSAEEVMTINEARTRRLEIMHFKYHQQGTVKQHTRLSAADLCRE